MASEAPPQAVTATVEPAKPRGFLARAVAVLDDSAGLLERFGAGELAEKLGLRERAAKARALDEKQRAAVAAYEASAIPGVIDSVRTRLAERKAEVAQRGGGKRRSVIGRTR